MGSKLTRQSSLDSQATFFGGVDSIMSGMRRRGVEEEGEFYQFSHAQVRQAPRNAAAASPSQPVCPESGLGSEIQTLLKEQR